MARKNEATPGTKHVRTLPRIPKGFNAETATDRDLLRHGIPLRPDPARAPGLTALWEEQVRGYRHFDHLEAAVIQLDLPVGPVIGQDLFPGETCGYELTSINAAISMFSGRWSVPNLSYNPQAQGATVFFHTFFGLGLLDVHVDMTVNQAQQVTAAISVSGGNVPGLAVRPGDSVRATLCVDPTGKGPSACFLVNETTAQTTSFSIASGLPPAVTVNAGISRGHAGPAFNPLARFGAVFFDDLSIFTTNGTRQLPDGVATAMVEDGTTLARPLRLTDFAFKIVHT